LRESYVGDYFERHTNASGEDSMLSSSVCYYRCPLSGSKLVLGDAVLKGGDVVGGVLVAAGGHRYSIESGIPHFVSPEMLTAIESQTRAEYDVIAEEVYDAAIDWQFLSFCEDEDAVRESLIDMLSLRPDSRVLEVGCGTGRDSLRLAKRLDGRGQLFMQDLSAKMLEVCSRKMHEAAKAEGLQCGIEYSVSNANQLPFPNDFFDAVFHFGGFNQFGDLDRAIAEFVRVTKLGGRILYGDEAVAPWLKGSEFDRIVTTNNPLFSAEIPLRSVPVCARDVTIRWIIGNCFYLISFSKGDGPPPLNLDLPHKGWRGGTMRTRYYGQLEGVTTEAKTLAREAAAKAGVSLHEWLDQLVKRHAAREIGCENAGDQ
jgi:ubiquinone/menaquinone biosynthesis C-methylase UbiE